MQGLGVLIRCTRFRLPHSLQAVTQDYSGTVAAAPVPSTSESVLVQTASQSLSYLKGVHQQGQPLLIHTGVPIVIDEGWADDVVSEFHQAFDDLQVAKAVRSVRF